MSTDHLSCALVGAVSGCTARTIVAPLERLKVMAQTGALVHDSSYDMALRRLIRTEGAPSMFRGNLANCLKVGPNKAIRFGGYERVKFTICANPARPTFIENLTCAGVMASVACAATHPLDTLKTQQCLSSQPVRFTLTFRRLLREGGITRLYAGLLSALLGNVPFFTVSMAVFMQGKEAYRDQTGRSAAAKLDTKHVLAISAIANISGQAVSYPLYCIKTNQEAFREGLLSCARRLYHTRGIIGGLYAGVGITTLKAMPSTCIGFVLYEEGKALLLRGKGEDGKGC